MASNKKLQNAHIRFIKENKPLYIAYSFIISEMSKYIRNTGCIDVSGKLVNSKLYVQPQN